MARSRCTTSPSLFLLGVTYLFAATPGAWTTSRDPAAPPPDQDRDLDALIQQTADKSEANPDQIVPESNDGQDENLALSSPGAISPEVIVPFLRADML